MYYSAHDLFGMPFHARDGNVGHLADLLFDEDHMYVRQMIAVTGSWMLGKRVTVPMKHVQGVDWWGVEGIRTSLSIDELRSCEPHSRFASAQDGISRNEFHYYGWPFYWSAMDVSLVEVPPEIFDMRPTTTAAQAGAVSARDILGYTVHATDGVIGHVHDIIFDDEAWQVHAFVVQAGNWLPGTQLLMYPVGVHDIAWSERKVVLRCDSDVMRDAPEYTSARALYDATLVNTSERQG